MTVLGLRFCARAFSSCGKRGPLFIVVRGPLIIAASLVAEHRLQTRRLRSCGSRAQLLRGMWDPPRPGLEPMSPALAGRFSTTAPPGKPWTAQFCTILSMTVAVLAQLHPSSLLQLLQQMHLLYLHATLSENLCIEILTVCLLFPIPDTRMSNHTGRAIGHGLEYLHHGNRQEQQTRTFSFQRIGC